MEYSKEEQKAIWFEVYLKERNPQLKDAHQYFADWLGIPRSEAKQLCYEIMGTCTSPMMVNFQTTATELKELLDKRQI